MDDQSQIPRILESYRWGNFLESTASGLMLHLTLCPSDGTPHSQVPIHCPRCGGPCVPTGDERIRIALPHGLGGIARNCGGGGLESGSSLAARAEVARKLLTSFIGALGEGLSQGQRAVELSTLRQMNQILISLFHGEGRVSDRAFDLILSALIILLDAEGSYLVYDGGHPERIQTKGDEALVRQALEAPDAGSLWTEVHHGHHFGRLGVVAPADPVQARALLPLLAQECVLVLEVERLFHLVRGQLTRILGAIGSAVILVDRRGDITYMNPAAEELLGRPTAELLGRPCSESPAPWLRAVHPQAPAVVRGYMSGLSTPVGERKVDWQAGQIMDGPELAGWLILADDRTDHARWLEAARNAERQASASALVQGLVAQVKGPLLSMHGMMELIGQASGQRHSSYYANRAKLEAERVVAILNRISETTRPLAGTLEPFDLGALTADLQPALTRSVEGQGGSLILELQPVPLVSGDAGQLSSMLEELVGNAAEALDGGGGTVGVRLEPCDSGVLIEVSDSGRGFSVEAMEQVFRPFFSTKGRSTGGLGLSTVQSIVHRHGGWITARNGLQGGALVTVWLPAATAATGRPFSVDVLVAISDPQVKLPVAQVLKAAGCRAAELSEGADLHETSLALCPAVLVVDEWSIGSSDLEIFSRAQPDLRIVVIGHGLPGGAAPDGIAVLERPIDYTALVSLVRGALAGEKGGVR